MFSKIMWWLRWAAAVAIGVPFAVWLVAVGFALLGFRQTAETTNEALLVILPAAAMLLALLAISIVVTVLVRWIFYGDTTE